MSRCLHLYIQQEICSWLYDFIRFSVCFSGNLILISSTLKLFVCYGSDMCRKFSSIDLHLLFWLVLLWQTLRAHIRAFLISKLMSSRGARFILTPHKTPFFILKTIKLSKIWFSTRPKTKNYNKVKLVLQHCCGITDWVVRVKTNVHN